MVKIVSDVLSSDELSSILEWFDTDDAITVKRLHSHRSKEPIWEKWNPSDLPSLEITNSTYWPSELITRVVNNVIEYDYEITQVNFQEVRTDMIRHRYGRPMIHADTTNPYLASLGKPVNKGHAILIPLRSDGPASTCWFDNHWNGLLTCFNKHEHYEFKLTDSTGKEVYIDDLREMLKSCNMSGKINYAGGVWEVNEEFQDMLLTLINERKGFLECCVSDYSKVSGYDQSKIFDDELRKKYFHHIPLINLNGLTIEQLIHWNPGDCYVWPRTQLHAATYTHSSKTLCTVFVVPKES